MSNSKSNRGGNPRQLEKLMADFLTGDLSSPLRMEDGRDFAAVMMGRRGGLRGGKARAEALSPERRREIAQRAAAVRWGKNDS